MSTLLEAPSPAGSASVPAGGSAGTTQPSVYAGGSEGPLQPLSASAGESEGTTQPVVPSPLFYARLASGPPSPVLLHYRPCGWPLDLLGFCCWPPGRPPELLYGLLCQRPPGRPPELPLGFAPVDSRLTQLACFVLDFCCWDFDLLDFGYLGCSVFCFGFFCGLSLCLCFLLFSVTSLTSVSLSCCVFPREFIFLDFPV